MGCVKVMRSPLVEREEVDDRAAAGARLPSGEVEDVEREDAAHRREAEQDVVRVRDEEVFDLVVLRHRLDVAALAAAALRGVVGEFLHLDEAALRDGDHHVAARDEVALVEARIAQKVDRRAAFVAELIADRFEFFADDRGDAFGLGEDVEVVHQLVDAGAEVREDLFLFEPGQAAQVHREDVVDLRAREPVEAVLAQPARAVHVLGVEVFFEPFGRGR